MSRRRFASGGADGVSRDQLTDVLGVPQKNSGLRAEVSQGEVDIHSFAITPPGPEDLGHPAQSAVSGQKSEVISGQRSAWVEVHPRD